MTERRCRGWFYVRQAQVVQDPTAPDGRHCLVLSNSVAGQNAHVLQAVGLDGRKLKSVTVSVYRRTRGISDQQDKTGQPRVELTFYDEDRALIRTLTLGPWDADIPGRARTQEIGVPGRSRFAVIVDRHVRRDRASSPSTICGSSAHRTSYRHTWAGPAVAKQARCVPSSARFSLKG